jgi:hypothetical protein
LVLPEAAGSTPTFSRLGSRKCFAPAARSASSTASSVAPILVPSAPGFQDCVLARHVSTSAMLEAGDANLLGGDISGRAMQTKAAKELAIFAHFRNKGSSYS